MKSRGTSVRLAKQRSRASIRLATDSAVAPERNETNAASPRPPLLSAGSGSTLSELDWAILRQLARDPLASNRALAEALRQPSTLVASRMRWLERRKVARVMAALDLEAMGQSFCFVLLEVRGRPLKEVAETLSQIRQVMMVTSLSGGRFDILVLMRFTDVLTLHNLIFGQIAKIEGVYQASVEIVLDVPVFHLEYIAVSSDYLPHDPDANFRDLLHDCEPKGFDELDVRIVAELQQNGRKSINEISRKHGLNAGTIRYRIKNLETKGLLRFVTILDPPSVGAHAFAFLEITADANRIDSVVSELKDRRWLPQMFLSTGPANILGFVYAESIGVIQRIKTEELMSIGGVIDASVSSLSEIHKLDLRWVQKMT